MSSNIKQATISGLIWNAVDRFGQQALFIVTGVILGRILMPENFGLIGLLAIFSTIGTSLVDSGFGTALVREKHVDEIDYSSMFVFNLAISIALYVVLFLCSPLIADFFNQPQLSLYARVVFLAIPINAFGIVQYIKILRSHAFKTNAKISVLSLFLSSCGAIAFALFDYGVWALVFQIVLYPVFRTFLLWYWGTWKVSFQFVGASLKKYMGFSVSFVISNLLNKLFPQMYFAALGRVYSMNQVGYYVQANKYSDIASQLVSSIVQGASLSTLGAIQDEKERYLNACRKVIRLLSFLLFPMAVGAICVARPAIILVLTEKWSPSVELFQLLCVAGVFLTLSDANINFLNIRGKAKLSLKVEVFKIGLAIVGLVFTINYGLVIIIIGQIVVRFICYIVVAFINQRIIQYKMLDQLKDIIPYAALSILMGGVMLLPKLFVEDFIILLLVQSVLGFVFYIGIAKVLRSNVLEEILQILRNKILKK